MTLISADTLQYAHFDKELIKSLLPGEGIVRAEDSVFKVESCNSNRTATWGSIDLDLQRDFGIMDISNPDYDGLVRLLVNQRHFCVRSLVMQSLQAVDLGNVTNLGGGKYNISAQIRSLNEVPTIISGDIRVGRFYYPRGMLVGEEVSNIAKVVANNGSYNVIDGYVDKHGNAISDETEGIDFSLLKRQVVSFSLPITTYYRHNAEIIDLSTIANLTRERRPELAKFLGQVEISYNDLCKLLQLRELSYVAQTESIMHVPDEILLMINSGYYQQMGIHHRSLLFDPKFIGRGRTEVLSHKGQKPYNFLEFNAFKVNHVFSLPKTS